MVKLIVICGPTATGKSELALELAQRLGVTIISADSRQVYRDFNIGTAKPTEAERQLVPHYLIDICDPRETLTLAEYQQQAQSLIEGEAQEKSSYFPLFPLLGGDGGGHSPHSSGDRPSLLVGGTGLYIKAVVRGLKIPRVAPQAELREQLASLGQTQCYQMLQQVDRQAADKIHPNDSVRTLRGLEVFYVSGQPISEQQGENPPDYPILQIGLDCNSENLRDRIQRRTEQMVAVGFVEEVEFLCQKYGADLPLLNTLGYAEMKQYLAGDISLETAKKSTVLRTRQFAKRQGTWFRANSQIEWFDADASDLLEKVWQLVVNALVMGSS